MPTPRRYPSAAARQAAHRQRQRAARQQELQAKGLPPLPAVTTIPGHSRWQALTHQARLLLQTVHTEMQDYYEQRTATWQESERGEAFHEQLQTVQEVLITVEELTA
jgi:hypothetical protein